MRAVAGSWVIVGDGETPPLRDAALVLDDDERIVAVGPAADIARAHPGLRLERHSAVLMPGLVNAHTHLELSALRGQVPGGKGFVPWVDKLVPLRAAQAPEADVEAIEIAVSELLAFGVVAVGEVSNQLAAVDALGSVPICGRVFHEVFGMRKDTGQTMLAMARKQRAARRDWPSNLSYTLAPHTPYTMHPEVLREIVLGARDAGLRTSLHLAEHAAERAFLGAGKGAFGDWVRSRGTTALDWDPPGCDPIRHVENLGLLGPHLIAVHLTDARPEELTRLAASGSPVVLCPRSNLHIELKLPPLLEILRASMRPGLGTDSLASNGSLDPLAEARALHQRFSSVAPRTLLAMATGFGADVLGYGGMLGRLLPGASPGLLAFEHGPSLPADPERFVLQNDAGPRHVLSRPAYHRMSDHTRGATPSQPEVHA